MQHINHNEPDVYFYHSDHLGSASWITDNSGIAVQHLQYLPYGEPFVDQRMSGYNERFTFTGKERDEETGYGYFGARYMDHELMTMWLSVDPMADKYPGISPYAYCAWNPVKLVDPDGRDIWELNEKGQLVWVEGSQHETIRMGNHSITNYDNCIFGHYDSKKTIDLSQEIWDFGGDGRHAEMYFEFFADHLNYEFSLLGYENNCGEMQYKVSTWLDPIRDQNGSVEAERLSSENRLKIHVHNHTSNGMNPSTPGNRAGDGDDLSFVKTIQTQSKDCKFFIYTKDYGGCYSKYQSNGDYYLHAQSRFLKPSYATKQDSYGYLMRTPFY